MLNMRKDSTVTQLGLFNDLNGFVAAKELLQTKFWKSGDRYYSEYESLGVYEKLVKSGMVVMDSDMTRAIDLVKDNDWFNVFFKFMRVIIDEANKEIVLVGAAVVISKAGNSFYDGADGTEIAWLKDLLTEYNIEFSKFHANAVEISYVVSEEIYAKYA
jgi:hypothetical protein